MSRKAKIITLEQFKEKIEPLLERMKFLTPQVNKDLDKIEFDWENWEYQTFEHSIGYTPNYEVLKNNLPVLWMYAGGDWESPVFFIIYWDGKKLRAYIPTEGNTYNKEFKSAWGNNDEDEDEVPKEDFNLMKQDIINRIKIC